MKKTIKAFLLLSIFTLFSCEGKVEETTDNINYQITELEPKVFDLDDETAFDRITPKYTFIDGKGYYHFFNRQNDSFYFYDYESGKLAYQVKLSSDGPDEVRYPWSFDYWVHDLDNIFINTMQAYYQVNRDGKVLKRTVVLDVFSFEEPQLSFDQSTTFENGKLYSTHKVMVPAKGDTSWLRAVFNLEKGKIEKTYLDERMILSGYEEKAERIREMSKTGGITTLSFQFTGDHKNLYGSSIISDSLYYFQEDKLMDVYFAGVPGIKSTDLDGYFTLSIVKEINGGVSIGPTLLSLPTLAECYKAQTRSISTEYWCMELSLRLT